MFKNNKIISLSGQFVNIMHWLYLKCYLSDNIKVYLKIKINCSIYIFK